MQKKMMKIKRLNMIIGWKVNAIDASRYVKN